MKLGPDRLPILHFRTPAEFRIWLEKNHTTLTGGWLRFGKKDAKVKSLSYAEALDEALCYGWIDSQKKTFDESSFLQKFTPRRARSIWSQVNTIHIQRLMAAGLMAPAGLAAVEKAKADGRWDAAYSSPKSANPPEDFLNELKKNKKAATFFATLNRANIYSIVFRLQTAKKAETRAKRMKLIIEMLAESKTFHPQSPR